MDSVSPVLTEAELPSEQVIALGQEQYFPIIVARVVYGDKSVGSLTRYAEISRKLHGEFGRTE